MWVVFTLVSFLGLPRFVEGQDFWLLVVCGACQLVGEVRLRASSGRFLRWPDSPMLTLEASGPNCQNCGCLGWLGLEARGGLFVSRLPEIVLVCLCLSVQGSIYRKHI